MTSNENFLAHLALQEPAPRVPSRSTTNPQSRVELRSAKARQDEAVGRLRALNGTEQPASGPRARLSITTDSTARHALEDLSYFASPVPADNPPLPLAMPPAQARVSFNLAETRLAVWD